MATAQLPASCSHSPANMNNVRMLQRLTAHQSDVTCCDFATADDYNLLVTGSSDKLVRVWEWEIGSGYVEASFSPLPGHKYGVTCVCVSPQATMLASTSIDGTAILWNLRTGTKMHALSQDNGDAVRICRFSPNSTVIVTAGDCGAICVWDLVHRGLIRTLIQHEGVVQSLAFTPDSIYLVSACTLGVLNLWSVDALCDSTNEECSALLSLDDAHDLGVLSCDFSQTVTTDDGESQMRTYTLATSGNDDAVKIWNFSSTVLPKGSDEFSDITFCTGRVLNGHASAVTCVKFSLDGNYLASTSLDKNSRIWNPETGDCIAVLQEHTRYVNCCAFINGSYFLATGSNDKSVIVWDLTGTIDWNTEIVRPSKLGTLQENAVIRIAENKDNEVILWQKLENIHENTINSCDINVVNMMLATGSADKTIKLFQYLEDASLYEEVPYSPLLGHTYSINQVEFSKNGEVLVCGSLDGSTTFWNPENGEQIPKPNIALNMLGIRTCRISKDCKYVVIGGDDEHATVYEYETFEKFRVLEDHVEAITSAAFSPDTLCLATVCSGGSLRLWSLDENDSETEAIFSENEAHDLGVQNCDFSDNDMPIPNFNYHNIKCYLLATCGNDSLVKLWKITYKFADAKNDFSTIKVKLYRSLVGHGGNVNYVRFSPQSGEIVCSVATDRQARIWSPYSSACLHVLDHDAMLTSCAFAFDCSLLAIAGLDKSVSIWKLPQQLVFQNVIAKRIKAHRKNTADWTPTDVARWVRSIDLASIAEAIVNSEVDGHQLLEMENDELTSLLDLDESTTETFFTQLKWLKRDKRAASQEENAVNIEDTMEIPHEYICPITQEIMRDPVICADGYTYERQAIEEWFLSGRNTSPMTNEEMENTDVVPNDELCATIQTFLNIANDE